MEKYTFIPTFFLISAEVGVEKNLLILCMYLKYLDEHTRCTKVYMDILVDLFGYPIPSVIVPSTGSWTLIVILCMPINESILFVGEVLLISFMTSWMEKKSTPCRGHTQDLLEFKAILEKKKKLDLKNFVIHSL
jgi:hypothetical protein